jgi:hypothetical protein
MNKLIQNIAVTAIVFSPLSLISLIEAAAAHHTPGHVSTVSMTGTKKKAKTIKSVKKGKKPVTSQKTAPEDTTAPGATTPTGEMSPSSIKQGGSVESPISKPGTDGKIPTTGSMEPKVPVSIPGGGSAPTGTPGTSVPSVPTVPTVPAVPGSSVPSMPK